MSSSVAGADLTSVESLTCNRLSSERNDLSIISVKIIRSYQVLLREDSLAWILEH